MRPLVLLLVLALTASCSSPPPAPPPRLAEPKAPEREPARRSTSDLARMRVLDLTHGFGPRTIYWPNATQPFARKDTFRGKTEGGFFYSAGDYAASEHGGTHLDAPIHFADKRQSADELPPSRLVGPAWVLDARVACAKDPDHLVSVEDLKRLESARPVPMPEGAIVLVLTGWGRYWPDKKAYLGDDRLGKTDALSFPGLDPALAKELVARRVRAVGIDTASIDRGKSATFDAHRVLAEANVPIFENVANLDVLPYASAWVVAAPMKIEGGTGGPLRLFALSPFGGPVELSRREVAIPEKEGPSSWAERLRAVAPTETELVLEPGGRGTRLLSVRVAPTFGGDERRATQLAVDLDRAWFRAVLFPLEGSDAAWKAPPYPLPAHPAGALKEPGTFEQRIARYEDPARAGWQKPDEVVKALALAEDAVVVDLGTGSGYFARRIAPLVPRGKVIGLDVERAFVGHVNAEAKKLGLANLEARAVPEDDPALAPASVDLVLIVDTYHHLSDRSNYLAKLRKALKPRGRIAIVDFHLDAKHGPPREHRLPKEQILEEARLAGLDLAREHAFLPDQYFVEFEAKK